MSDNVTIPVTGTGDVSPIIAADDVSGVKFQQIKIDGGTNGVSTPVVAGTDGSAATTNPVGFPMIAKVQASAKTYTDGNNAVISTDINGFTKITPATLLAGENLTVNRMFAEDNYTYSRKIADGQVLSAAGYVHHVSISPIGSVVSAGVLTLYDSLTASGTIVYSTQLTQATAPHTINIMSNMGTGFFIGFSSVVGSVLSSIQATAAYRVNP